MWLYKTFKFKVKEIHVDGAYRALKVNVKVKDVQVDETL